MTDAVNAVRAAAAGLPTEIQDRFEVAIKLSDEDRDKIIEIASKSLADIGVTPKPEERP